MVELTDRLRRRFRTGDVWRQNLVYQDEPDDQDQMTNICLTRQEISISDWGLKHREKPLVDASDVDTPVAVTEDLIADRYRDDITGDIKWDAVRDAIHERYADDYDTKVKAGNAKGCIKRFVFDASIGDTALINTVRGTVFSAIDGPPMYDPEQEQTTVDRGHVFRRSVRFIRDDEGEVLIFDNSGLPTPIKPNQLTITEVDRNDLKRILTHADALAALADTADLTTEETEAASTAN